MRAHVTMRASLTNHRLPAGYYCPEQCYSIKERLKKLNAKIANLKFLINYGEEELSLQYDSAGLEQEIYPGLCSLPAMQRVEYQQLQAQLRLHRKLRSL